GVGAIPNRVGYLKGASPALEGELLFCAPADEKTGRREPLRVGPDEREPPRRLVDEVAEVRLPAPVVVAEEDEAALLEHAPAREVNRRQSAQGAVEILPASQRLDERERAAHHLPPVAAVLDRHHVGDAVLRRVVLPREEDVEGVAVLGYELRRMGGLE